MHFHETPHRTGLSVPKQVNTFNVNCHPKYNQDNTLSNGYNTITQPSYYRRKIVLNKSFYQKKNSQVLLSSANLLNSFSNSRNDYFSNQRVETNYDRHNISEVIDWTNNQLVKRKISFKRTIPSQAEQRPEETNSKMNINQETPHQFKIKRFLWKSNYTPPKTIDHGDDGKCANDSNVNAYTLTEKNKTMKLDITNCTDLNQTLPQNSTDDNPTWKHNQSERISTKHNKNRWVLGDITWPQKVPFWFNREIKKRKLINKQPNKPDNSSIFNYTKWCQNPRSSWQTISNETDVKSLLMEEDKKSNICFNNNISITNKIYTSKTNWADSLNWNDNWLKTTNEESFVCSVVKDEKMKRKSFSNTLFQHSRIFNNLIGNK